VERIRKPQRACVTLSTTPAFAAKWLVPKLAAFQALHPHIDLHVHASNAPVDLDAGSADLAIRYGHGRYPGTSATLLLDDHFAAVASPALAATLPRNAARWPLIHFDWDRPPPLELTWAAWARASGRQPSALSAGIRYSEESHAIQAVLAGQGVALLSLRLVEEELRMGLLRIVAEPRLRGMSYHLVQSQRRRTGAAAATVKGWLLHTACQHAEPADP
jgi:LysR family transcriptional regulator, glycine cleavage system transcriptional activator